MTASVLLLDLWGLCTFAYPSTVLISIVVPLTLGQLLLLAQAPLLDLGRTSSRRSDQDHSHAIAVICAGRRAPRQSRFELVDFLLELVNCRFERLHRVR